MEYKSTHKGTKDRDRDHTNTDDAKHVVQTKDQDHRQHTLKSLPYSLHTLLGVKEQQIIKQVTKSTQTFSTVCFEFPDVSHELSPTVFQRVVSFL